MVAQTDRRVLWHPRQENKFAVGGGANITLYEWVPDSATIRHVTSQDDLQHMKCFAWSPDASLDDLIAVGLSNGKIELMRLEATRLARNGVLSRGPSVTLPVRNTRACNALSFCTVDPTYLAAGYDKVRGDSSLVIWDLQSTMPTLTIPTNPQGSPSADTVVSFSPMTPTLLDRLPRSDNATRATDGRVLQQHLSGEIVSSLSFLPTSKHTLVAGISNRWLRLFDLRNPTASTSHVASKVQSIATDPFDAHRFACSGDGAVTVWDARSLAAPLLSFTNKDASADGARTRTGTVYTTLEFSSTRRGTLATLEKDANNVRFWDVLQTPPDLPNLAMHSPEDVRPTTKEPPQPRSARLSWARPSNMLSSWAGSPASGSGSAPVTPEPQPSRYSLVLADTRKTKSFARALTSFALVPSPISHPLASTILLVNKDGDLELYALRDTPKQAVWSARGALAIGAGTTFQIMSGSEHDGDDARLAARAGLNGHHTRHFADRERSGERAHSEGGARSMTPVPMREYGTRLGAGVAYRASGVGKGEGAEGVGTKGQSATRQPIVGTVKRVVESDISVLMRKRAIQGYGLVNPVPKLHVAQDDQVNGKKLADLWSWLDHSRRLLSVPTPRVGGYDFSHQGLLGIWEGLPQLANADKESSPGVSSPTTTVEAVSPASSQRTLLDKPSATGPHSPGTSTTSTLTVPTPDRPGSTRSSKRSLRQSSRRGFSPTESTHGQFYEAVASVLARANIPLGDRDREKAGTSWRPSSSVPTAKLMQRRLAMELCGWRMGEEYLSELLGLWETEGHVTRAACWLVFTEQYTKAIELLMRSKDDAHFMLSGTVSALTSVTEENSNKVVELRKHSERLVLRLQDPYARAMLTRLTSNDWYEVVQDECLPLRERLAIAFQFMDDIAVSSYLHYMADRCCSFFDIEGLIITGLTESGMDILEKWVDGTGDVQSAAILASYVSPCRIRDKRVDRWVETYRDLLDGWKLFHDRCDFDIGRGRILEEAAQSGQMEPFEWAPRQISIRCNYCNKPIGFQDTVSSNGMPGLCPSCSRPLPRCSICLLTLHVVPDAVRNAELARSRSQVDTFDDALIMCQTCRHGGHASHILAWFFGEKGAKGHVTCPVADCDCHCTDEM